MYPLVEVMMIGAFLSKHYNSVHDNTLSQLQVGTIVAHHPAAAGSRNPRPLSQIWNTVTFIHQRPVIKPLIALIKGRHNVVLKSPGHRQLLLKSLSIFLFSFACTRCVLMEPYLACTLAHFNTLTLTDHLLSSVLTLCDCNALCVRILIYGCWPQILFLNS